MSSNDEPRTLPNLATFQFGELSQGRLALLLAYATNMHRPSKRVLEAFVIGTSRHEAKLLADSLMRFAAEPPSGRLPQQRH